MKPWSSINSGTPEWLRDKKIHLLVQFTQTRHRELQDVPAIVDLARDDEQRQILSLFAGGSPLGTALLAPPGVPDATVTALRRAFDAAMRDPALLAEVTKARVDIEPITGEELQRVVAETFNIRADVLARARKLSVQ